MPITDPTDIADLEIWFDAADTGSITDAGGGAVSQWDDKSGNAHHVTQATGANRPSTGTTTVNALNAIDFDGTTDNLFVDSAFFFDSPDITVFTVARWDASSAAGLTQVLWSETNQTDTDTRWYHTWRGGAPGYAGSIIANDAGSTLLNFTGPRVRVAAAHMTTLSANASTLGIVSDDSTVQISTTYTRSGAATFDRFGIGANVRGAATVTGHFDGAICEIVGYVRALNSTEIADVQAYLTAKWALVAASATVTPFAVVPTPSPFNASAPFAPVVSRPASVLVPEIRVHGYPSTVAGLQAWYDASDELNGPVAFGGVGPVLEWGDETLGDPNRLVQGASSFRPGYGVLTQNSLNVVDFDGNDNGMPLGSGLLGGLAGFTVFAVAKAETTGIRALVSDVSISDNDPEIQLTVSATDLATIKVDDNSNTNRYTVTGPDVVDGNYHIFVWTDSLTEATLAVDGGTPVSSGAYTRGTVTVDQFSLGNTERLTRAHFWDGQIAEVIVYEGVVSGPEIQNVVDYLGDKWGLATPNVTVFASVVIVLGVVPLPTIPAAEVNISPAVVTGLATAGAPTVLALTVVTPSVVAAIGVVPAPTPVQGSTAMPVVVTVLAVVNTPGDFLFDHIIFPATVDAG